MLKLKLAVFSTLFFNALTYAQEFNDTIVTLTKDTIFCKVTYVNDFNIFYQHNPKRKLILSEHIERQNVAFFSIEDTTVVVLEEKFEKPGNSYSEKGLLTYREENGIIYPSNIDSPPIYGNGLGDLNNFIINNTRVYPYEVTEFKGQTVTVLFSVQIDSLGHVKEVRTEAEATTGSHYYDSRHLESELCRVISLTKRWKPAITNSEQVKTVIYLPLKFYLQENRLFLLSSQLSYSLKEIK